MTDDGRMRRFKRLNKASAKRARFRGQREAHKRGLDVRRVKVNACVPFGWEAWYGNDPRRNLREFCPRSVSSEYPLSGVFGVQS